MKRERAIFLEGPSQCWETVKKCLIADSNPVGEMRRIYQHCGYWRQLYYKNTYSIVAEKASLSHFDTQSQKIWEKRKTYWTFSWLLSWRRWWSNPLPSLLVVLFYSLWHLSNPECIVCKWTCQPSGLSQIKYIHHHPSQIKARIDWNSANPRAPHYI